MKATQNRVSTENSRFKRMIVVTKIRPVSLFLRQAGSRTITGCGNGASELFWLLSASQRLRVKSQCHRQSQNLHLPFMDIRRHAR